MPKLALYSSKKTPPQPSSLFYLATGSLTGITCSNTSIYATVLSDDSFTSLQKSKAKIPSEHVKGCILYVAILPSNNSTLLPELSLIIYLIKDVLPSTSGKHAHSPMSKFLESFPANMLCPTWSPSTKQCNCDKMVFVSGKREGKEVWGLYPQFLHTSLQTALPAFLLHALPWPLAHLYMIGSAWPKPTLFIKR